MTSTEQTSSDQAATQQSSPDHVNPARDTGPAVTFTLSRDSWWAGRGDLAVGLPALIAAGLLLVGTLTMTVRGESQPGPQFFPIIVVCLLTLTGGWITVGALLPRDRRAEVWHRPDVSKDMLADISGTNTEVLQLEDIKSSRRQRARRAKAEAEPAQQSTFDWRTFGLVVASVVVFAVLLNPVGWIFSATLLFWMVCYALGSKRRVFDIGVGLLLSSFVQLAFGAGLGLNLPAGFIGWIF